MTYVYAIGAVLTFLGWAATVDFLMDRPVSEKYWAVKYAICFLVFCGLTVFFVLKAIGA